MRRNRKGIVVSVLFFNMSCLIFIVIFLVSMRQSFLFALEAPYSRLVST